MNEKGGKPWEYLLIADDFIDEVRAAFDQVCITCASICCYASLLFLLNFSLGNFSLKSGKFLLFLWEGGVLMLYHKCGLSNLFIKCVILMCSYKMC